MMSKYKFISKIGLFRLSQSSENKNHKRVCKIKKEGEIHNSNNEQFNLKLSILTYYKHIQNKLFLYNMNII